MKAIIYYTDNTTYTLRGDNVDVWEDTYNNEIIFEILEEDKIIDKIIKSYTTTRVSVPKGIMLGYVLRGMEGTERSYEVVSFSDRLKTKTTVDKVKDL